MLTLFPRKHKSFSCRAVSLFVSFVFAFNFVVLPAPSYAQGAAQSVLNLPAVGTMVTTTPAYAPTLIKGITIHPDNALMFDFVFEDGDIPLEGEALKEEFEKLIKYFLAALTVPEKDLWVNLSPYEGGKVIPAGLGDTEMGRDLLAQDYLLKQVTASLMYPEEELGRKFWDKVFERAYQIYGKTNIPLNTFNKVWIVPDKAVVLEEGRTALVVESHLKVMLEEDYAALEYGRGDEKFGLDRLDKKDADKIADVTSKIVREVLIPAIEEEINNGETFANLRQIYHAMVLATWYKQSLKESLLGQVYVDQNKTQGVDTRDKEVNQKIYAQYMEAFQKGVYDYIRHDYDKNTKRMVQRKYFSGGFDGRMVSSPDVFRREHVSHLASTVKELTPQKLAEFSEFRTVMATTGDMKVAREFDTAIKERFRNLPVNGQKIFQEAITATASKKRYHIATAAFVEGARSGDVPMQMAASPVKVDLTKVGDLMEKVVGFRPSFSKSGVVEVPHTGSISDILRNAGIEVRRFADIQGSRGSAETTETTPRFEHHLVFPGDNTSVIVSLPDGSTTEISPMELEIGRTIKNLGTRKKEQYPGEIVIHTAQPDALKEILNMPYVGDRIDTQRAGSPRTYGNVLRDLGVIIRVEQTAPAIVVGPRDVRLDTRKSDVGAAYRQAMKTSIEQAAVDYVQQGKTTPAPIVVFGGDAHDNLTPDQMRTFLRYMEEGDAPPILNVVRRDARGRITMTVTLINSAKLHSVSDALKKETGADIMDMMPTSLSALPGTHGTAVVQGNFEKTIIEGGKAIEEMVKNNQGVRNSLKEKGISSQSMVGYVDIGASARPVVSFADAIFRLLGFTKQLKMDPGTYDVVPVPEVRLRYADFTDSNNQLYTPKIEGWTAPETLEALVVRGNPVVFSASGGQSSFWDKMKGVIIDNQAPGAEPLDLGALDIARQLDAQLGTGNIPVASITITPRREVVVKAMPSVDDLVKSSAGSPVIERPDGTGGIDFNSAMLNLQIKRDGAGVPLPVSNQPIGEMNIQGFVPVILNIQTAPTAPMPFTLGEAQQPAETLSRAADY